MRQRAADPVVLHALVERLSYRPGWRFELADVDRGQGSEGLTFSVYTLGYDTYHPERGETYRVVHYFPVPPAAYDERSWRRWLLERILEVERHEACEFFQIDGERPYAPHHGPGNDPYIVFDHGTDEDARTSFRGEVKEAASPVETARDAQRIVDEAGGIVREVAGARGVGRDVAAVVEEELRGYLCVALGLVRAST